MTENVDHDSDPGSIALPDRSTHRAADSPARRLAFVDNARALGIVLVVVGHAPGFPAVAIDVIFAFHMPLFFLLSGLMVGPERLALSTLRRATQLARTLLIPYLFYFVVAYVYWLIAKRHGLRAQEMEALAWWDPVVGFLRGSADGLYVDVVLWFFPALFVTAMAHHILRKCLPRQTAAVVAFAVAFAFIMLHRLGQQRWPWSADCAVVALAFYATGSALHARLRWSGSQVSRRTVGLAGSVAAFGCVSMAIATGRVDLNHLAFGIYPGLYLVMSTLGIVAAMAIAFVLPPTRVGRWLSTNTLVIFPLHFLIFSVITGIAIVVLQAPPSFKDTSPWIGVYYTAIALAGCWPAAFMLRATVPWLIGGGRPHGIVRVH